MKKILLTTLCFLILLTGYQCAETAISTIPLSDYAGTWVNVKPEGGITKIVITVEGLRVNVQAFGSCQPKDCDWGQVKGTAYSSGISTSPQAKAEVITVEYQSGPGEEVHIVTNLIINPGKSGQLYVRSLTRYTDDSGRYNRTSTHRFIKAG